MSANQSRLELRIDVLDRPAQRAIALPTLLPAELVAAVIEEFTEIETLAKDPARYQLLKAATRAPLDEQTPVGKQLAAGERLAFVERQESAPAGTRPPSRPIYLREQGGTVYKLAWLPAIIGRPDASQPNGQPIAVDLSSHSSGQRVSRRHAQITETNGQFYVELLSQNPTSVKSAQGTTTQVSRERMVLQNGDTIVLENSQIALKCIISDKEPAG